MREITPESELVANAEKKIKLFTTHQAFEMLKNETGILADLRDILELARTGSIEDTIQAPRGMLEFWMGPIVRITNQFLIPIKSLSCFVLLAGA